MLERGGLELPRRDRRRVERVGGGQNAPTLVAPRVRQGEGEDDCVLRPHPMGVELDLTP